MDDTLALLAAPALALGAIGWALPRAWRRLQLSRAKHRSLTGHSRMAKRVASLIPGYAYDEERFFGSDGAPAEVQAQRRAAFRRLCAEFAQRYPNSVAMTAQARDGLSDLQFTGSYRVPFQYSPYLREHLKLGSFLKSSSGVCVEDLDGNRFFDLTGSYGVNVLGYDAYKECIAEGVAAAQELGPVLGAYHPALLDNVNRLREISGLDEVSFHMSGTEAVMQAVRVARYHTRRSHLVRFSGAYHGWWEDVQPGPGNPLPPRETYTARDVSELAKVFTGWDVNGFNPANPTGPFGYWRAPMDFNPSRFDTSDKQVLGVTIPGSLSGPEALSRALDIIFAHPNVGPFIARQLIQRLVTSNPSPAYVSRVARVFNNNGASPAVRGDLKAVIRAVLADPEARPVIVEPPPGALNTWRDGKLREPIVRLLQWLRLARCSSVEWNVLDLSASDQLGQAPLRAPSVFNFYRPGYVPPNTVVAEQGLVAPEFQITHESSVVGYLNFLWGAFVTGGWGRVTLDYRDFLPLADDAPALVDRLNLYLTGRTLSATTVSTIVQGVQSILGTGATERLNRVLAAFYLIMVSPEYLVQR